MTVVRQQAVDLLFHIGKLRVTNPGDRANPGDRFIDAAQARQGVVRGFFDARVAPGFRRNFTAIGT
jgi:hypothetical protein